MNIALPAEGGASAARGLILLHFLLSRGFGSVPKGTVFPHLSFRNRPFPPFLLVGCSRGGGMPQSGPRTWRPVQVSASCPLLPAPPAAAPPGGGPGVPAGPGGGGRSEPVPQDVSAPQLAERGPRVRGGRWSVPGFPLRYGRAALQTGVCQPFPLLPQDLSKSPKTMKKLLPKRKPERKPSDEEFALRKSECLRGHTWLRGGRRGHEGGEAGPRGWGRGFPEPQRGASAQPRVRAPGLESGAAQPPQCRPHQRRWQHPP